MCIVSPFHRIMYIRSVQLNAGIENVYSCNLNRYEGTVDSIYILL